MTDTATAISPTSASCTRSPIASPSGTEIEWPLEVPTANLKASSRPALTQRAAPPVPTRTAPVVQPVMRRLMWSLADVLQLSPTPSQRSLSQLGGADRSPRS